ncbi:hypothetical protein KDX16_30800 [Burkholderia vietnamiensis]|uniref:hypothetical protein n=1 Tax=Burkholderia vietnamiensis TaxID=60552 RepID=UPI001B9AA1FF|nr:hypothetical protein [Burkholderia vietnamiensis]MBR7920189.1 hypothetical protein [Burkholderia vietnamiensis]MBR8205281.1 hypothetical protein [Burkholderia vietnamiensis]HDR9134018.1 hypothetical protein [Burkholderia vietnamiensis]
MKRIFVVAAAVAMVSAAHAEAYKPPVAAPVQGNAVELRRGVSLHEQTREIVQREGYTLVWKLPVDATADGAAHPYLNWVDAIYGATKQLSQASVAGTKVAADLAAPVVCDGTRTIVITTLRDARQIVKSGAPCHDLK